MTVLETVKLVITIIALVVLVVAYLSLKAPIADYLASKMSKEDYENLMNISRSAVKWAEQWLKTDTGASKKAKVLDYVTNKAIEYGLDVDESDIDKCIEGAVSEMKG